MKATTSTRFKITPFENAGGSMSWRVSGTRRNGERIRENYPRENDARCRQTELEAEYLQGQSEIMLRSTKLTEAQVRVAESIFTLLPDAEQVRERFMRFLQNGAATAPAVNASGKTIDEAFEAFKGWLDGKPDESGNNICTLREISRRSLRLRVNAFVQSAGHARLDEITPERVEEYLGALKGITATTKSNYMRDISRFFSWCIERPRKWLASNPCEQISIARDSKSAPEILSVENCEKLLEAAEKGGLAAYTAIGLFAGLRPFEISRLTWKQINLADKEIRLEKSQTKTGRARVVEICDTLAAWLKAYEGQEIFPSGWHKRFRAVKTAAGIKRWPIDVMRHTSISHYFRKTGSYGQTAERYGNSESIIKQHYQGLSSTADMKTFYALKPTIAK
jgi:integrase